MSSGEAGHIRKDYSKAHTKPYNQICRIFYHCFHFFSSYEKYNLFDMIYRLTDHDVDLETVLFMVYLHFTLMEIHYL